MNPASAHADVPVRYSVLCLIFAIMFGTTHGCARYAGTTRVVDGQQLQGRAIASVAYAAYLKGALLETNDDVQGALGAYRRAFGYDEDSPEIATRIGRLLCRLGRDEANEYFAQAVSLDKEYAAAWRERARCALRKGDTKLAVAYAKQALGAEPLIFASTHVLVDALEQAGEVDAAYRYLVAFVAQFPLGLAAQTRLLHFSQRHHKVATEESARQALVKLETTWAQAKTKPSGAKKRISKLLRRGNLRDARTLAVRSQLQPVELALIALDVGALKLALAQAELVLGADPTNSDARIVGLSALHRLGAVEPLTPWLQLKARAIKPPSPETAELLRRLLRQRVSEPAARAWQAAYGDLP